MVDFDLFRTQLTEAGFDLHKVEEIYERIRGHRDSPDVCQRYSLAGRPPRMTVSCSSV
jgi:hypothetical protein